jgi:histidyl-tRNA synthetase
MAGLINLTGMGDILPDDWPYYDHVIGQAVEVARLFGYRRIETPNLGQTSLFARTTGEGTDIVEKEMYSFRDRGGEEVSLRPEGTAPVMRAYLEHGMARWPQPVKLFYIERMYRAEKPQRGRYREHRQFGCEAIGSADAYVDVEMICLLDLFYRRIGLDDLSLGINTIGDETCRPRYLRVLVEYLREHESSLAQRDRERLERNPLRVLDSKEAVSQPIIEAAPHMIDFLCDACAAHWARLQRGLAVIGIPFRVDHRLVRGLDYYTRTVFEFAPPRAGSTAVVGGGGRYDALTEAMGAKRIPGVGFGTGLERLVLNIKECGIDVPPPPAPRIYFVHHGPEAEDEALREAALLRRQGVSADLGFGERSVKSQMKHADHAGARYAAIFGEDELESGTVTLRSLRGGGQETIPAGGLKQAVLRGDAAGD